MPQLITPPIRTALLTQNGVPFSVENGDIQTTRDWWLYWNRLGDQLNLAGLQTSQGAHSDRPVPDNMPDGAVYVESDRGVIYQVQDGDWVYVAGIMYGTISPDQRPTDLGPNDSGFAFTATDPLASDTGRTFVWSGTAWVETSQVLYGTHANRPAPAAAPARCLYAEADRGPLFQNQLGQWVYIAGTMWGTISPDQRPTDLGTFDAGFTFRTNVAPAREFVWSGTAWVETTPLSGASLTHANVVTKVGATPGTLVEGGITDESAANSDQVHITATGDCGIGRTPSARLHVYKSQPLLTAIIVDNDFSSAGQGIQFAYGAMGTLGGIYHEGSAGFWALRFKVFSGSAEAERVTIRGDTGSVGIGTNFPTYQLQLSLDSAAKPVSSTWSVPSDLRLKQNVETAKDDSLSMLDKLDWIRYEYNGKAGTPKGAKGIGLLAQELRKQLPDAVRSSKTKLNETDTEETDVLAIDYHHILVHSARAIQQLSAEVKRLGALIEKPA